MESMSINCKKEIDEWFKSKFDKLTRIKESFHEMSSCTYENQYTNFGKEREYLIDLHKGILEKGKHETKDLRILIQNIFNDYDEAIRKYRGIIPLDYSTHIIPDKAHAEEGEKSKQKSYIFSFKLQKRTNCRTNNRNH